MGKQKIPITALSMSENIPGIEYKRLINNKITNCKLKKAMNEQAKRNFKRNP